VGLLGVLLLVAATNAFSQCRLPKSAGANGTPPDAAALEHESLLPESGLLTSTTYTSLYFGFTFELPIPLEGHRLMLPIRLAGEHALLGIGFQNGQHYGTLEVTAGGRRDEGEHNMTPEQEQEAVDNIARSKPGAAPMERLDYAPEPIKLKRVDKHAGEVHGTRFSARIKNYMVRFTIQTNDKSFLAKARKNIEDIRVFCTDAAGSFFTVEGKPFNPKGTFTDGPTIPTATVDEAISSRPAEQTIPHGSYIASGEYRIPQLGLSYTLPEGWTMTGLPSENVDDPSDPALAQRLNYLWAACARTLFRAVAPGGSATVQLRALDQSCLGLPSPTSHTDTFGSESLGEYLQMLGRFGKIKPGRLVESGGRLFSVYPGTVFLGPHAQDLEHRSAEVILATRYRKLILAWCWSAPSEADLRSIPSSSLILGDSPFVLIGPSMVGQ
jgi:hypothetical protein